MDTDSFMVYIKTEDVYKDIAEDVETRFDTWNYELDRLLPKRKRKKSNWINERKIRRKNHDKTCYSYLIDDGSDYKKTKRTKACHKKKT